ncbi:hemojuvelin isoform X1 [Labeo rohita]|uniref:hemojuvelin isoform X1 n=1 Tax=Labeo rohita TaxID=84645 RepID=UPI0021E2C257|nr:hemojuvelin isoform X1 [Labeo rohita]XP_050988398.1 hemojuvelin isoform X1 [Labeo rohita]
MGMAASAVGGNHLYTLWKHIGIIVTTVLLFNAPSAVGAQCRILRCNSDFVAATLEIGVIGGGGKEGANAGYCSALRSYALCTQRTARACRGDLAYHSAVQGIEDLLIQHRCPKTGPTAQPQPPPRASPLSGDGCFYEKGFMQREGRAPEYLHCGVFGDPHIRTFNEEFQTCAVQGAWPLIDNQNLYIQATSTPTRGSSYTTVLTKITVILKNWRECAELQIYQAELDNVPPAFVDGSVTGGDRRGHQSLRVHSHDPGRHAEIWATHIGTTIVVRQVGRSLSLSVRSPRAIVESYTPEQDLQLCVWGCPVSQRLEMPYAHPSMPAYTHCSSLLPVRDVYFHACLFDLQVTGDLNGSASAVAALEDARAMISDPNRVHLLTDRAGNNPPSLPVVLALIVFVETLRHAFLGPV